MKFVPAGSKGTCQQLGGGELAINAAGKDRKECRTVLVVQDQVKGSWGAVGIQIEMDRSCTESGPLLHVRTIVLMGSAAQLSSAGGSSGRKGSKSHLQGRSCILWAAGRS